MYPQAYLSRSLPLVAVEERGINVKLLSDMQRPGLSITFGHGMPGLHSGYGPDGLWVRLGFEMALNGHCELLLQRNLLTTSAFRDLT